MPTLPPFLLGTRAPLEASDPREHVFGVLLAACTCKYDDDEVPFTCILSFSHGNKSMIALDVMSVVVVTISSFPCIFISTAVLFEYLPMRAQFVVIS